MFFLLLILVVLDSAQCMMTLSVGMRFDSSTLDFYGTTKSPLSTKIALAYHLMPESECLKIVRNFLKDADRCFYDQIYSQYTVVGFEKYNESNVVWNGTIASKKWNNDQPQYSEVTMGLTTNVEDTIEFQTVNSSRHDNHEVIHTDSKVEVAFFSGGIGVEGDTKHSHTIGREKSTSKSRTIEENIFATTNLTPGDTVIADFIGTSIVQSFIVTYRHSFSGEVRFCATHRARYSAGLVAFHGHFCYAMDVDTNYIKWFSFRLFGGVDDTFQEIIDVKYVAETHVIFKKG